jgi:hypothetical protein
VNPERVVRAVRDALQASIQAAGYFVERVVDVRSNGRDGPYDRHGDQRSNQSVFDSGCAGFIRDKGFDGFDHVFLSNDETGHGRPQLQRSKEHIIFVLKEPNNLISRRAMRAKTHKLARRANLKGQATLLNAQRAN